MTKGQEQHESVPYHLRKPKTHTYKHTASKTFKDLDFQKPPGPEKPTSQQTNTKLKEGLANCPIWCYDLNVPPPPNSYIEIQIPKVRILGGGVRTEEVNRSWRWRLCEQDWGAYERGLRHPHIFCYGKTGRHGRESVMHKLGNCLPARHWAC